MDTEKPGVSSDTLGDRRLREASKYVARTWMPVNPTILSQVQTKIQSGAYQGRMNDLVKDLKSDISLYSYTVSKLGEQAGETERGEDPVDLIRKQEINDLKQILSVNSTDISSHRIEDMRAPQATRLKHSIISCSATEVLSAKASVDPDKAYTTAMLRQLGYSMVAWNYPSSLEKAQAFLAGKPGDIEAELTKILGFTPQQLGYELTVNWNKNEDFKRGLRIVPENKNGTASDKGESIAELCQLGESLARMNDPEHYPGAARRWKEVEKRIVYYLGPNGISRIHDRAREISGAYSAISPGLLGNDISPERFVKKSSPQFSAKLYEQNGFIKRCPEALQRQFRSVYEHVIQGEMSAEAMQILVSTLIPAAGFERGCVFLIDPNRMMLIPRVRIGDASSRQFKPVSCSCGGEKTNPLSEAFHCVMPIKEENVILHGDVVSHVSGRFGNNDKGGILYLEPSEKLLNQDNHVPVQYFKAIRQCLDDCLALN